ncbi:hypothetical protein K6Y21_08195 [Motilimonas eburnea]|nr:hypothetical protein [Motilimonas eburnea]MCE2571453.1 hypothetical protein [Motilimonas eburnea]
MPKEDLPAVKKELTNQKEICRKFNAEFAPCSETDKLGLAVETLGQLPINGLRLVAENGTSGWYIWCGETMGQEADFFKPLHVSHINKYLPEIEPYLALPTGYRFLVADDYEDVWYDALLTKD